MDWQDPQAVFDSTEGEDYHPMFNALREYFNTWSNGRNEAFFARHEFNDLPDRLSYRELLVVEGINPSTKGFSGKQAWEMLAEDPVWFNIGYFTHHLGWFRHTPFEAGKSPIEGIIERTVEKWIKKPELLDSVLKEFIDFIVEHKINISWENVLDDNYPQVQKTIKERLALNGVDDPQLVSTLEKLGEGYPNRYIGQENRERCMNEDDELFGATNKSLGMANDDPRSLYYYAKGVEKERGENLYLYPAMTRENICDLLAILKSMPRLDV
jgi:hypothetical protein